MPEHEGIQKILIIGSGGAGKSTLAIEIGHILSLPVIHLDALNWQPGWVAMPKEEWHKVVEDLVQQECWIMDGNYAGTMELRLQACDMVIFLIFSKWICLYRMFKRVIRYYGQTRPDLGPGCPEQLPDWSFIRWIWTYPKLRMPKVLEMLRAYEDQKTVVFLRSPAETQRFLATMGRRS